MGILSYSKREVVDRARSATEAILASRLEIPQVVGYAEAGPTPLLMALGFSEIFYKPYFLALGQETLVLVRAGRWNINHVYPAEVIQRREVRLTKVQRGAWYRLWLSIGDRRLVLNFNDQWEVEVDELIKRLGPIH